MKGLAFVFVLAAGALSLNAANVFTDGFETYGGASGTFTTVAAPNTFGSWNVTAGSIDILNAVTGVTCHGGTHCIDMDGSTSAAGTITRTFMATAGTSYALTFWYSGNQRGSTPESLNVSFGAGTPSTLTLTNVPANQAFTLATVNWTAAASGTATVQFAETGNTEIGNILDDVSVDSTSVAPPPGTPVPPSIWLTLIGLAAIGFFFGSRGFNSRVA